jgi:TolA-binding protein
MTPTGNQTSVTRAQALERMCAELRALEVPLDDLAQARAESRLEAALRVASDRTPSAGRLRSAVGRAAAVALVAAAAIVAGIRWRAPLPHRDGAQVRSFAARTSIADPGDATAPVSPAPPRALELRPFQVTARHTTAAAGAKVSAALMQPAPRLTAPAGLKVRATLASYAAVTLVGPATVTATESGEGANLALSAGRVLVTLRPDAGRRLRVIAGDTVVTVVGTVFSVAREAGTVQIAVLRGEVRVESRAGIVAVGGGRSVRVDGNLMSPLAPSARRALQELREHDRAVSRAELDGGTSASATERSVPAPRPAASPLAPADTPEDLYRRAEAALAARDRGGARDLLLAVVARFAEDPRASSASYELALMAFEAGELADCLRHLERVRDPALDEPRAYLACQVRAADGASQAEACLLDFRRRFPRSAHDAATLAQLGDLQFAAGNCAAAKLSLSEYLRRFPGGSSAAAVRARLDRCAAAAAKAPP